MKRTAVIFLCAFLAVAMSGCGSNSFMDDLSSNLKLEEELSNTPVTLPINYDECIGKNYADIEKKLKDAGFENITLEKVEDLKGTEEDKLNIITDIVIEGNDKFEKGIELTKATNIKISYHSYHTSEITMHIDFLSNLIFSKYDVKLKVDDEEQGNLKHGENGDFSFNLYPGKHSFVFEKNDSASVNGTFELDVKDNVNVSLQISCHSDKIDVKTLFIEDMSILEEGQVMVSADASDYKKAKQSDIAKDFESFGFKNITLVPVYDVKAESSDIGTAIEVTISGNSSFKHGDVFSADDEVIIKYHEDSAKDPVKIEAAETLKKLEENVSKEMSRRAVIVAMTNCQATDVFTSDGNSYDPSKFHSYSDIDGFFMTLEEDGTWSAYDENTWLVKNIILRIYNYDTYLQATGKVKKEGDNYIFFDVDRLIVSKYDVGLFDASDPDSEHFEPSDFNSFLTVPESLIKEDRNNTLAQQKMNAKDDRKEWIQNQFNWWDGRHEALSDLIKKNLNDEKSFKHKDASYIDVCDEEMRTKVKATPHKACQKKKKVV